MSVLILLHGNGWDELALMAGAILIAFVVVKFTTRGQDDEADETDESSPASENASQKSDKPSIDE